MLKKKNGKTVNNVSAFILKELNHGALFCLLSFIMTFFFKLTNQQSYENLWCFIRSSQNIIKQQKSLKEILQ